MGEPTFRYQVDSLTPTQLRSLQCYYGIFGTGEIPDSIGQLVNLRELSLFKNQFSCKLFNFFIFAFDLDVYNIFMFQFSGPEEDFETQETDRAKFTTQSIIW